MISELNGYLRVYQFLKRAICKVNEKMAREVLFREVY